MPGIALSSLSQESIVVPPSSGRCPSEMVPVPSQRRGEGSAGAEALVLAPPLTASIFGAGTKGKIFLAFIPNPAVLENMNNYRGTLRSKINPQATLVSFGEYGSLFILSVKSYDDLAIIRNILNIRLCDINHKEKDVTLTGRGGGQIPR